MRPLARGRFGVSAWIYGDAPLPETLARIARAGFDGVGWKLMGGGIVALHVGTKR